MRKISKILAIAAAVPLLLAMLIAATVFVGLSPQLYFREYDLLHQEDVIGCDRATLDAMAVRLIDYMNGDAPNLDMQAMIGGEEREAFSERDKAHMVDVKALFDFAKYGVVVGGALALALLALSLALAPRGVRGKTTSRGFLWGCAGFFALVGLFVGYCLIDFSGAFVTFHKVFFNNDLWLLPADSVLLQMMPQTFFVHLATMIGLIFGGMLLLAVLLATVVTVATRRARVVIVADASDGPIAAVMAEDGDRYVIAKETMDDERPAAQDIFAQFGLSDADDAPLMPDEPETVRPPLTPVARREEEEAAEEPDMPPLPAFAQFAAEPREEEPAEPEAAWREEEEAAEPDMPLLPPFVAEPKEEEPAEPFDGAAAIAAALSGAAAIAENLAEETPRETPPAATAAPMAAVRPVVGSVSPAPQIEEDGTMRVQLRVPTSMLGRAAQGGGMKLLLEVDVEEDGTAMPAIPAEKEAIEATEAPAKPKATLNAEQMQQTLARMEEIMAGLPIETE